MQGQKVREVKRFCGESHYLTGQKRPRFSPFAGARGMLCLQRRTEGIPARNLLPLP